MHTVTPQPDTRLSTDDRLRRIVLVIRQACYFIADELGKEYDLSRPCKQCDEQATRRGGSGSQEARRG